MNTENSPGINTLLEDIRNGHQLSFEAVYHLYKPLIRALTERFISGCSLSPDTADDLFQEATIALYKAALSFDDTRNVSFGLYAKICMKNRMLSYIRAEKKLTASSDLFDDISDVDGIVSTGTTPEQLIIDKESLGDLNKRIESSLTEFEKSVFWLYLGGLSYLDISEALLKPKKSVDNAILRIKAKLRKLL